jgi:uroporphyrinogen decarboxylase
MNARQRYVEALTFGHPDRIPFSPGGPRESTLKRWHGEGLPEGVPWRRFLLETLGFDDAPARPHVALGVDFRMIPQFEEKILEHRESHYIVQDWKGNICEISDQFEPRYLREAIDFVTRRWLKCPVENRDDWEQMKTRYRLDSPGRFPADLAERGKKLGERDWPLEVSWAGPFWQMREWCGFENLCMMMIEDPAMVADMAAFWTEFVSKVLERLLAAVVPDNLHISEDMAYKAKAMISPAMTRQFIKPSWDRWAAQGRAAGVPIIDVDSDGFIGELIPLWIESGVNVCDPVEVAAHNDINDFRRQFGHRMGYVGGVDKRAMAKGGQVIREELARLEPVIRDGGFIPGCDHGVPSDISWPDFLDYSRLLAQLTGWL